MVSSGLEVAERILDDLVVAHRGTAGDARIRALVAQSCADAFEGPRSHHVDARVVANLRERTAGECADERRRGFGASFGGPYFLKR